MKTINVPLLSPVRVTPLTGTSFLRIFTTGDVLVNGIEPSEKRRKRSVTLADTGKGLLTRSPKGLNRTVRITLPVAEATEMGFLIQITKLFRLLEKTGNQY